MLFKTRFHPGIVDGSITETYRAWSAARARAGARHRVGRIGEIEVTSVDPVALGRVSDAGARRAGFADREDLVSFLRKGTSRRLDRGTRVWRVRFRYVGRTPDPRLARGRRVSAAAVKEALDRVSRMDARSPRGPWVRRVLTLIDAQPRVAASRLAPRLGRETPAFKADVRKLKEHGLTISHEVGYSLSPLGREVLARAAESPTRSACGSGRRPRRKH